MGRDDRWMRQKLEPFSQAREASALALRHALGREAPPSLADSLAARITGQRTSGVLSRPGVRPGSILVAGRDEKPTCRCGHEEGAHYRVRPVAVRLVCGRCACGNYARKEQ